MSSVTDEVRKKLTDEAKFALDRAWRGYQHDVRAGVDRLFSFDALLPDPAVGFVFPRLVRYLTETVVDPLADFADRLRAIPARLLAIYLSITVPLPKGLGSRVVTLDGAVRNCMLILGRIGIDDIATLGTDTVAWLSSITGKVGLVKILTGRFSLGSLIDDLFKKVLLRVSLVFLAAWKVSATILAVLIIARFYDEASDKKGWNFALRQNKRRRTLRGTFRTRETQ